MNQGKLEVVKQETARVNIDILGTSTPQHSGQQGAEAHHTLAGRVADAPQAVVCTPSLRRAQLPALPHAAHQQALSPQKRLVFGKPLLGWCSWSWAPGEERERFETSKEELASLTRLTEASHTLKDLKTP